MRQILIVALILLNSWTFAQKGFYFGPTFGFGNSFSTIDYSGLPYKNLKNRFAFSMPLGVQAQYGFNDKISLSTGVFRVFKEYKIGYRNNFNNGILGRFKNVSNWSNIWFIPITLKYRKSISKSDKTFFAAHGGISFDFYNNSGGLLAGGAMIGNDTSTAEDIFVTHYFTNKVTNSLIVGTSSFQSTLLPPLPASSNVNPLGYLFLSFSIFSSKTLSISQLKKLHIIAIYHIVSPKFSLIPSF